MFDPQKPITLKTNVFNRVIGAVISQSGTNRRLHPVAVYSRKLSAPELNYKIHNKKLLAIVDTMKHWRVYLEGPKHQVQV